MPEIRRSREERLTALVGQWTDHMRWRKDYDRWREDRLWQEDGQASRLQMIEREAGPPSTKRVLDIGSGMGGFLVAAARNGIAAIGIEPNATYCTITRLRGERYGLAPTVIRSVGERLPFPDATFDVVLAQDILEHVQDPTATLREMRRVLRPDGCALVTVINRLAWRDPHYHLRGINWLPRSWGDRVVERIGRSKRGARFSDHQRLVDMYYDTLAGFTRRAATCGFSVSDMKEGALRDGSTIRTGARTAMIGLLSRLGLVVPVYRAHRYCVDSIFELALRPMSPTR
jgi:SAM-dependent methyltransferase